MSQDEESTTATVRDAPTTTMGILRNVGPGMILAGSIVGSGELIATTRTGAEAHFDFLWLIIIGCIIKVFAQIELGRYAITNGKTTLAALNEVPGPRLSLPVGKRRATVNWILLYWFLMFLAILGQQGGIVGGVGQAMAISVPLTEEGKAYNEQVAQKIVRDVKKAESANASSEEKHALKAEIAQLEAELETQGSIPKANDDVYWSLILTLAAIFLLVWGKFSFIQRFSVFLVAAFTLITIANLFALQSYDKWSVTAEELRRGLSFGFPAAEEGSRNPLITALATFGIIGVGAAELLAYPYWCLEKGYGKYVGKRDDSDAWAHRAKGWMKVMHWDAWGAMVVYTFCTIAFYLLGAAVLGRSNLLPEGSEMIQTLSAMYQPVFGSFTQNLFLFGAFAVLFSTFYVAIAAQGRLAVDVAKVSGIAKLDETGRQQGLRWMGVVLPTLSVLCYVFFPKPVVLVLIAGTMQAIMLPLIGFAVLYFRYKKSDERLQPNKIWDFFLWLSFVGFLIVGIYQTYAKLFQ
ncbi:MAG: transmembrane Mn(2+) transporter [Opitutae bacterium]|nr:transmembrane Mn(2+) transporter [Opitutae bacterium]